MSKLYEFSNDGFTNMQYKKGSPVTTEAEGWCFGYSTNWCIRMIKNPGKPLLSQPTQMDAGPLQQKVEMLNLDWDGSVSKVVTDLGYSCAAPIQRDWNVLPGVIAESGDSLNIVDIGDHWLGMGKKGSKFYFFDANAGLYEYSDKGKFKTAVEKKVKAYKDDPDPSNGFENQHKAYEITK